MYLESSFRIFTFFVQVQIFSLELNEYLRYDFANIRLVPMKKLNFRKRIYKMTIQNRLGLLTSKGGFAGITHSYREQSACKTRFCIAPKSAKTFHDSLQILLPRRSARTFRMNHSNGVDYLIQTFHLYRPKQGRANGVPFDHNFSISKILTFFLRFQINQIQQ